MPTNEADLRARLHDIERHLAEMPPHNASGSRDELERQRVDLQRRLAAGTRADEAGGSTAAAGLSDGEAVAVDSVDAASVDDDAPAVPDPREGAPRSPAGATPPLVPGTFRRTTHVAAGPVPGTDYGDGVEVERDLHGACRDVRRTADGAITVVDEASLVGHLDLERRMTHLEVDPGPTPAALLGEQALPGFRTLVVANVEDVTDARSTVLLDLGIGGNLSAYGRMQAGRQSGKSTAEVMRPDVLAVLGDSCRGWALDGPVAEAVRRGTHRRAGSPAEVPEQSDADWHDLGELPPWWVRRRRRIDVVDLEGATMVDAAFRDSWRDAEGVERALHEWELQLELDADGIVARASATPKSLPFGACPLVADDVPGLVGTSVVDLRQAAREVLGGPVGCTHLNDLLSTVPAAVVAARRSAIGPLR